MRIPYVLAALLIFAACDKPVPKVEPVDEQPAAAQEPTTEATRASPAKLSADGKDIALGSILAWELKAAGSLVPQFYFYADEVACEDRVTHSGTRLYSAALIGEDGFPVGGPYDVPNWSFSDQQRLVPMDRASITITKVTETEVHGIADYSSKSCSTQVDCTSDTDCEAGQSCDTSAEICTIPCPFELKGEFVAKRCPVHE